MFLRKFRHCLLKRYARTLHFHCLARQGLLRYLWMLLTLTQGPRIYIVLPFLVEPFVEFQAKTFWNIKHTFDFTVFTI